MSDRDDEVFLDIDPMLFLATYIEDQVQLIDMIDSAGSMSGLAILTDGVADVAREQIEEAQASLDALIEADKTWDPPLPIHWGSLLGGQITCDCGWKSTNYVHAADAEEEFAAHLVEMGVKP